MARTKMNMNNSIDSLQSNFEDFIAMQHSLGNVEATIKNYKINFAFFMDFIGDEQAECSIINNKTIPNYSDYIKEKKPHLKPKSIQTYLRNISVFLNYLMDNEKIPIFRIKLPKAPTKEKVPYTKEELQKILAKPDMKTCDFTEYRNWVIAMYTYSTGHRLSSVCNVKVQNVDLERKEITLETTKNKKELHTPISPALEKILKEYLKVRGTQSTDNLFLNMYGESFTLDGLKGVMRKYNRKRGVNRLSFHLFRHTFATHTLSNGVGVKNLQALLGHSTPNQSLHYAHVMEDQLKEEQESKNPLDTFLNENKPKQKVLSMNNKRRR